MVVRGGSKGKKRETLRSLGHAEFDLKTATAFYKELEVSSDRAAAILGATSVQTILRRMIVECLVNSDEETVAALMERDGALATFFSVNHLARAMGVIPKLFLHDLETIRRVRNAFAHSVLLINFEYPEIKKEILKLVSLYHSETPVNEFKYEVKNRTHSRERNLFISTCRYITFQMTVDREANGAAYPRSYLQKYPVAV